MSEREPSTLKTWREASNGWTAKLAAILFALQVLLAGFAGTAGAHAMPRDQFGNVICTSADGHTHPGDAGSSGPASEHPDCCTLGCAHPAAALAPPPNLAVSLIRRPVPVSPPFVTFETVGSAALETPRLTRGPPARA